MVPRSKLLLITALIISLTACDALGGATTPALQGAVVPTRIATSTPTQTPTVTATFTTTPTDTPTNTPENTATPTLTATSTATATETSTSTPENTATPTTAPTDTPSPTAETPIVQLGSEPHSVQIGEIRPEQPETLFVFDALANDLISVRVVGRNGFDPRVTLKGENNTVLAENDNIAPNSNDAIINNFIIPQTGSYTIVVSQGELGNVGAFEIVTDILRGAIIDPASGITIFPIPPNGELQGMIDNNHPFQAYVFEARAGAVVTIEMNQVQGDLDPYLVLVNRQTQEVMIENDDDGASFNARIIDFSLPQPGQYIILATRYQGVDGITSGEFRLRVIIRN